MGASVFNCAASSNWISNTLTMSQKPSSQERSIDGSGVNRHGNTWTTYDDGAYRYNNAGSNHHNHYFNDAQGKEYCTGNGGKEGGFKWSRTDQGEKNVKYDNRK